MGISRPSGWAGFGFRFPASPKGPETRAPLRRRTWAGGRSSLLATLSNTQRPRPGLDRGLKDAAAPGAGPAGDRRRLPRGLGAAVSGAALLVVQKQGRGPAPAARRRGRGRSPGSCCGGDGRTEPGAPRGRCGPKRGQEREVLGDRAQSSAPCAPRTHPHPSPGGVRHWAGTRTRPTRGRRYGGGGLAGVPKELPPFSHREKAPPPQGC